MLRRIPSTPLVCLAIFLSTILAAAAWAAGPDESLDVLLKPNQAAGTRAPVVQHAKARPSSITKVKAAPAMFTCAPPPLGITKVKPAYCPPPYGFPPPCILPAPMPGQWEIGAQVLFARIGGKVLWPRWSQYTWGYNWGDDDWMAAGFNDRLMLPGHKVLVDFKVRYQFRPNGAIRYSVIPFEVSGGGILDYSNNWFFVFGNQIFSPGQPIQSKWQHAYQRLGLEYDAIRTCAMKVSIFADWVHVDDRIDVNCNWCGLTTQTFSKSTDAAMVGMEVQRCVAKTSNGGTFSCDYKAGVIFGDDTEGYDLEAGGRYSIPLNRAGRWGYVKGGYRSVQLKKTQNDYLLKNTLEGGFMEFGFIF
jgi:hypothetical protein